MHCRICKADASFLFKEKILTKYNIDYFYCKKCGFIQTEEHFWLKESYVESINISDTGIMQRNLNFMQITTLVIVLFFDKKKRFVDFAGGYGVLVRLMRDVGFDYYWYDVYSDNLMARGFEYNSKDKYELLTCFEAFEHFHDPMHEIDKMIKISNNILFSTELYKEKTPPNPDEWDYYGFNHGQHISFFSIKTLNFIAKKYNLNLYTNGSTIHLLTKSNLRNISFKISDVRVFALVFIN